MFNIYLLMSTLSDKNPTVKEILSSTVENDGGDSETEQTLSFFKFNTGSIEIVFRSELIRVYFPIQPICRLLSKTTRESLMEEIPRSTPGEKIEGLVEASEYLFNEMEHLASLKSQVFYFSSMRLDFLRVFSYFLSLVINVIVLISYHLVFDSY